MSPSRALTLIATLLVVLGPTMPGHATLPVWAEQDASAELVQPIVTTIRYGDGSEQRNRGSGFVIGSRFYTAYHNLQAGALPVVGYEIELGDHAVRPLTVDAEHDLAVFEIPPALCARWCNDRLLEPGGGDATRVVWLQLVADGVVWRQGRVSNVAFKAPLPEGTSGQCEQNLVVEVDEAFAPGESGGPVFDADTGAVVGLIQGSFQHADGRETGYYKPARCVLDRLSGAD